MRKITIAACVLLFGTTSIYAQRSAISEEYADKKSEYGSVKKYTSQSSVNNNGTEAIFWTQDFANGIPATWVNNGSSSAALWEYRGPSTSPSNAVGSRGAYAGPLSSGNQGAPIVSPTASNGFVIFDSDYLDNSGIRTNAGNGPAPAPHVGTLTTETINLQAHPTVELSFSSYYRVFQAKAMIAFSTDGGLTWPDSINVHEGLGVNASTANPSTMNFNVTCFIGGQSNVKMRFIFDGTPGNANGNGYYFWMLDDISLADGQDRDLRIVNIPAPNEAPALDIIFGPAAGSANTGVMTLATASANATNQTRDVTFDCNVANFGKKSVLNSQLVVEIYSGGALLTTRSSSPVTVPACDTVTFASFNTYNTPWKPTALGIYDIVYTVIGDSVGVYASDTITIRVDNEELGVNFSNPTTAFGTLSVDDSQADGITYAPEFDFVQTGKITGVYVDFQNSTTHTGGSIEIAIYDTSGFTSITTPYDNNKLLGTSSDGYNSSNSGSYTIGVNDSLAGSLVIPVTDGINPYIELPAGGYSVQIILYSNGNANPIQILNDETFSTRGRRLMFIPGDQWYSGFTSLVFNAPMVNLLFTSNIGVDENILNSNVKVGPNPVSDVLNVSFNDIDGDFTLTMTDITGRVISTESISVFGAANHTMNVNGLAKGVYMLNINNGKASVTHKISVQ
jgi:hypothetical protein